VFLPPEPQNGGAAPLICRCSLPHPARSPDEQAAPLPPLGPQSARTGYSCACHVEWLLFARIPDTSR
jgi:hypothetical protein